MKKIIIKGNKPLSGTIKISGAKNSVVALLPAAILCDEETTIYNVPEISDIDALIEIIKYLNCDVVYENETVKINPQNIQNKIIEEELSQKLRASYYFMGALLSKFKKVEMFFPGGCNIGTRPIDLHLKGFKKLGATVKRRGNKYTIIADHLIGNNIYLDFASVGATINLMLAAVKAEGNTTISNAAKEPEIVNIATFLNNMGAKITGAGTSEIRIKGVKRLKKAVIEVIPDRIEAGTYIIIGSLLGKDLHIDSIIEEHLESLFLKLNEANVNLKIDHNSVIVNRSRKYNPISVKTQVYPGFATDLAQPMAVLLTQCTGESFLEESIWENRMGHVKYLNKMGSLIKINDNSNITIHGKTPLCGEKVVATDLRGGAAMIIAGLIAKGETEISNIEHILRGYDKIVEKLSDVGANIKIVDIK